MLITNLFLVINHNLEARFLDVWLAYARIIWRASWLLPPYKSECLWGLMYDLINRLEIIIGVYTIHFMHLTGPYVTTIYVHHRHCIFCILNIFTLFFFLSHRRLMLKIMETMAVGIKVTNPLKLAPHTCMLL